ncbi:metallophosphoesterase [bacterium]|nr:metallophosphoesterase [bacterium]
MRDGAQRGTSEQEIGIWANSPQTEVSVRNPAGGFLRATVRWRNVPKGAFLVSPEGVADAPSREGTTLSSRILVAGNSEARWKLDPNLKNDYTFVVSGGDVKGLELAKRTGTVDFGLHLGNALKPLDQTLNTLSQLPFPTYVVPGNRDRRQDYVARTGEVRREFAIGRDRFLILDNAEDQKFSSAQRAWAAERLRAYRAEDARRIFVFMHWPMVDPRKGKNAAMYDRQEIRALQALFKEHKVTAVFASHIPIADISQRQGVDYYIAGPGHAMVVQSQGSSLSIRALP